MGIVSQNFKKYARAPLRKSLWLGNGALNLPVTIEGWYGRLGNNIQQISLAIIYAKKNGLRATTPDHTNIKPISFGQSKFWPDMLKIKNRFFYFSEPGELVHPFSDITLEYRYICENIQDIAREFIAPNFKFKIGEPLGDNVLVIHLRGGDVFREGKNAVTTYVQNPLSFYQNLIKNFDKTILVCEPGHENPIVSILKDNPAVTIQSSSVEEDFSTLLRAKNIATSGVGTFAIAAALCSKNITKLFCTNLYLKEHLNPEMVKNADVHCIRIGDEYLKIGSWSGDASTISRMLSYQVDEFF